MPTLWSGWGIPSDNIIDTDIFMQRSRPIQLQEAQTPTEIILTVETWAVNLYTPGVDPVAYNIDDPPGPLLAPMTATLINATPDIFPPGGFLVPGNVQQVRLPEDSIVHSLFLMSAYDFPVVYVALLEKMA